MASLISGYEYDIFISYRQKDNKHDGWVTEFVNNLKGELESTFKEEISVYFDINPHDGLLETHDVDESLKGKLKCLIFIPVISRTYCDPKSFAWEHEFKAFVEQASQDQFGLKIKLPNGNVANRVLPVRIHDLDFADVKECELVLGGVLRGIEFIYREPGVDKPLVPEDDEKKNLNNTKYRIQIIKVAHAIKEIILGIKEPVNAAKEKTQPKKIIKKTVKDESKTKQRQTRISGNLKFISIAGIVTLLLLASILSYLKIFKHGTLENLRSTGKEITVVIMPFQNMTSDSTKNFWQEMIQDNMITSLSNSEELKVRQIESIARLLQSKELAKNAAVTPAIANLISKKLDANVFISGSINQSGSTIRLNAKVINAGTEDVLKSFQINGKAENILTLTDSLSIIIKNFLLLSKIKNQLPSRYNNQSTTNSPEAFRYFIYGRREFFTWNYAAAQKWLYRAISIDSSFVDAFILLSKSYGNEFLYEVATTTYGNESLYDSAKKYCLRAYKIRDRVPLKVRINIDWIYSAYFETPVEQINYMKQLVDIDNQDPNVYHSLGNSYYDLMQYDKAIPYYEKVIEIYNKWGLKQDWIFDYTYLGESYRKTGQYDKAMKIYKLAEKEFPDDPGLTYNQALLYLQVGDSATANQFVEKGITWLRSVSSSESNILAIIAGANAEIGLFERADKYYRKALLLEPENPINLNNLAFFLIDKDRNIKEGIELADKALKIRPDYYLYLYTKGRGLYKQGKYQEALNLLQKSWDLRMKTAVYDHNAFLHLDAAKKAVATLR
jgi:tetratricopeptide (TPR) repeat protein